MQAATINLMWTLSPSHLKGGTPPRELFTTAQWEAFQGYRTHAADTEPGR
jgi:hypothetical protein